MSPFSLCIAVVITLCLLLSFISACPNNERKYLLDFKGAIIDTTSRLDSWQQFNCCQWQGVTCDPHSAHVVSLDLRNPGYQLTGKIHTSLFRLQHLQYLDLSLNNFTGTAIPPQLAKFNKLAFLNLAEANFGGEIPLELGNITTLRHLDLSLNDLQCRRFAGWVTSLRSLEYLAMGDVLNIPNEHWGDAISSLPNLREISLDYCELSGTLPSLLNLTRLSHLTLSGNPFYSGPLPAWFQNVSSLVSLDLSRCGLNGSIPSNFLYRSSLTQLDLSLNELEGIIPHSIANFARLERLDLSYNNVLGDILCVGNLSSLRHLILARNQLSGTIPLAISKLFRLETLSLFSNHLNGTISLSVLENLAHLKAVHFSGNQLTVYISPSLILGFPQLDYLGLGSCNLQGEIPPFLSTLYSLSMLNLSDNNMVGYIPSWLWDISDLQILDLSHNRLEGSLPPLISTAMWYLNLRDNRLYGSIPDYSLTNLLYLDLSGNGFNSSIHQSICSASNTLIFLDLSNNKLTGVVPKNIAGCFSLGVLNLAQNYLEGEIPKEIGNLTMLETLKVNENKLQGVVPPTIVRCVQLRVFDIGKNKFQGRIPDWIGELGELRVLGLAFNNFQGTFPSMYLRLKNLQILNLSHNNLSGPIPESLRKLNSMRNQTQTDKIELNIYFSFTLFDKIENKVDFYEEIGSWDQVTLWIKGHYTLYIKIISAFKFMDLSYNKLSGSIPEEMGELKGLISLNISNNNLRGSIPKSLGGMNHLESLDLSGNRLSGNIPTTLVNLTFLSFLNLSYNHLYGIIPHGNQFATFEASSYVGNPNLHGFPLENGRVKSKPKERGGEAQLKSTGDTDSGADDIEQWWEVSVGLCFGVGFASVIAVLCFHLKWRYKCFSLQDSIIQYLFEH